MVTGLKSPGVLLVVTGIGAPLGPAWTSVPPTGVAVPLAVVTVPSLTLTLVVVGPLAVVAPLSELKLIVPAGLVVGALLVTVAPLLLTMTLPPMAPDLLPSGLLTPIATVCG